MNTPQQAMGYSFKNKPCYYDNVIPLNMLDG